MALLLSKWRRRGGLRVSTVRFGQQDRSRAFRGNQEKGMVSGMGCSLEAGLTKIETITPLAREAITLEINSAAGVATYASVLGERGSGCNCCGSRI